MLNPPQARFMLDVIDRATNKRLIWSVPEKIKVILESAALRIKLGRENYPRSIYLSKSAKRKARDTRKRILQRIATHKARKR